MPRTERFELRLSADDVETLDKLAAAWKCTRAEAARRAVREYAKATLSVQTSVQPAAQPTSTAQNVRTTSVQTKPSASTNTTSTDKQTSEEWNKAPWHQPRPHEQAQARPMDDDSRRLAPAQSVDLDDVDTLLLRGSR